MPFYPNFFLFSTLGGMNHFFSPNPSPHLRSDAHQSLIIGWNADVDHTQTIGRYIPPPPGFGTPDCKVFGGFRLREKLKRLYFSALVMFFGGLVIGAAYLASQLGRVLQTTLSLAGLLGGPSVAVYTMGLFLPFTNSFVSLYRPITLYLQ